MLRWIGILLRALVVLLIALVAAVTAMRLAIHGREVRVPNLVGLDPQKAEQLAIANGLILSIGDKFYSADVPEGKIISQAPEPNAKVRRGWNVRVAQSLGPQRVAVPNVVGESMRAAEINLTRRGLEIGSTAELHLDAATEDVILAQDPSPDAARMASPKVNLLVADAPEPASYVMPSFTGHTAAEAAFTLEKAGLQKPVLARAVQPADAGTPPAKPVPQDAMMNMTIAHQSPEPGKRVTPDSVIRFEVR